MTSVQDGDDPLCDRVHGLHGVRHHGQAGRLLSCLSGLETALLLTFLRNCRTYCSLDIFGIITYCIGTYTAKQFTVIIWEAPDIRPDNPEFFFRHPTGFRISLAGYSMIEKADIGPIRMHLDRYKQSPEISNNLETQI